MPVELRKRPAPPPAPPPAKKKAPAKAKAAPVAASAAETPAPAPEPISAPAPPPTAAPAKPAKAAKPSGGPPKVGDLITLDGFGGEVETNDGKKTSLASLVADSKSGVVLFTYPKASTPGCTKQACLFRDSYEPLTAAGLSIFGLSSDSPKANTTFKTKQNLQYTLLCDPEMTLISAIGFKKPPKSTNRGVFVVDKSGKVLVIEPGSPSGTVDAVTKIAAQLGGSDAKNNAAVAATAAEVADTAAKIDSST